ncbi:hypothetical protein ACIPIN_15700 [Pseudomonas sp. NPDC087697]|uniref:hypothetical protein n=1 Tax=Pseudomonas sp. NPDC087697 TaxID=3364447 RepID=UPI0037F80568
MSDHYYYRNEPRVEALRKGHIAHAVRVLLGERLAPLGLDPEKTYISAVDSLITMNVTYSVSLFEEALQKVQENYLPNYDTSSVNIFAVPYSFEGEHRIKSLELLVFERMLMNIVKVLND